MLHYMKPTLCAAFVTCMSMQTQLSYPDTQLCPNRRPKRAYKLHRCMHNPRMLADDGTHQHLSDRWALRRRGARNMAGAPAAAAGEAAVDASNAPARRCDDGLRRALRLQAVAAGTAAPHEGGHWRVYAAGRGSQQRSLAEMQQRSKHKCGTSL